MMQRDFKKVFMVNPAAGNAQLTQSLHKWKKQTGVFEFVITKSREDAIAQTRTALKSGFDHVIAIGGDGTLNAIVNGFFEKGSLINPEAVIGLSRLGSGCDYFKAVSKSIDWKLLVNEFTPKNVDVGRIEFLGQEHEPIYFINMASVGLSSFVVGNKTFSYTWSALKAIPHYCPEKYRVVLDGVEHKDYLLNIFVAKGKTAGGGMKLGENAEFDDGRFDVTLVREIPRVMRFFKFPKLFTGNFAGDNFFVKTKATQLEVYCAKKMPVEFDGEIAGSTDIRITLLSKSLQVAFPIDANTNLTKI